MIAERKIELSAGFGAGNYANAYETEDLDLALAHRTVVNRSQDYRDAFIVGFFATYEPHEIPLHRWYETHEAALKRIGEDLRSLGLIDEVAL